MCSNGCIGDPIKSEEGNKHESSGIWLEHIVVLFMCHPSASGWQGHPDGL